MKVRMKFSKVGPVRFVGHLDFMRYFTRAVARSGLPGAYTVGYSPHLLISFAAPLGVGEETLGDYADVELAFRDAMAEGDEIYRLQNIGLDNDHLPDPPSSEELCEKMNRIMADGVSVLEARRVGQTKASKAMALVRSASYELLLKDGFLSDFSQSALSELTKNWFSRPEIMMHKKTKKSEKDIDIKPMLYTFAAKEDGFNLKETEKNGNIFSISPFRERDGYTKRRHIFVHCATGSTENLKPGAVLEQFCGDIGCEYDPYGYQIVRIDTFAEDGRSLGELGTAF